MAKKLRHLLFETDAFENPKGLQTRFDHLQASLSDPVLGRVLFNVRDREARKFSDQYEEDPKPETWVGKVSANKQDQ